MRQANDWVSVNGELTPADQGRISAFDSGFMQGIGLFETLRVYNGVAFQLDRHLERLIGSAQKLQWPEVPQADVLREEVRRVTIAAGGGDALLRVTVSSGSLRIENDAPRLTTVVSAAPSVEYPPDYYRKGVTITISGARQSDVDPLAGVKHTSYFARLTTLRSAHLAGSFESLWLSDQDTLAEGSISSLFLVIDGVLVTPTLDTPIVPGLTRARVIELAATLKIPVQQRSVDVEELRDADECFLTSALIGVMPVVRVSRAAIGEEKPGEVTRSLYEAYLSAIDRECVGGA